jgi:hypothetical protein
MWIELVKSLATETEFHLRATRLEIGKVERALGVTLPLELQQLLYESNGIFVDDGLGLIWSTDQIIKENIAFRSNPEFRDLYMPFDPLLFFADAGNGDQVAFCILNGAVQRPDIFAWNHEDDSRMWAAPTKVPGPDVLCA